MAIDIILATSSPASVRDFLVARNIVTVDENNALQGTLAGFEYTVQDKVPNPFVVSGSGTEADPYVYNSMKCFLVRFSSAREADEIAGQTIDENNTPFDASKIVRWVKNNGTQVSLTDARGWSVTAWRANIGGNNVFLASASANEHLPQWQ